MRLTDVLALSHVPRWTSVAHSRTQSVGDHTFRVMVIAVELAERLGKELSLRGLTYAMYHDGAECHTGDIPGHFKRELPGDVLSTAERKMCPWLETLQPPSEAERRLVKLADRIETYTFIKVFGVGSHAQRVTQYAWDRLVEEAGPDLPAVRLLIQDIVEEQGRG